MVVNMLNECILYNIIFTIAVFVGSLCVERLRDNSNWNKNVPIRLYTQYYILYLHRIIYNNMYATESHSRV